MMGERTVIVTEEEKRLRSEGECLIKEASGDDTIKKEYLANLESCEFKNLHEHVGDLRELCKKPLNLSPSQHGEASFLSSSSSSSNSSKKEKKGSPRDELVPSPLNQNAIEIRRALQEHQQHILTMHGGATKVPEGWKQFVWHYLAMQPSDEGLNQQQREQESIERIKKGDINILATAWEEIYKGSSLFSFEKIGFNSADYDLEAALKASEQLQQKQIGHEVVLPMEGFVTQNVSGDGSCLFYAIADQLLTLRHPMLLAHYRDNRDLNPATWLRRLAGSPSGWGNDDSILALARQLDVVIAVIYTKGENNAHPIIVVGENDNQSLLYPTVSDGFRCFYIDGNREQVPDSFDENYPKNKPLIRLGHTGNHFISIHENPILNAGAIRQQLTMRQVAEVSAAIQQPPVDSIREAFAEAGESEMQKPSGFIPSDGSSSTKRITLVEAYKKGLELLDKSPYREYSNGFLSVLYTADIVASMVGSGKLQLAETNSQRAGFYTVSALGDAAGGFIPTGTLQRLGRDLISRSVNKARQARHGKVEGIALHSVQFMVFAQALVNSLVLFREFPVIGEAGLSNLVNGGKGKSAEELGKEDAHELIKAIKERDLLTADGKATGTVAKLKRCFEHVISIRQDKLKSKDFVNCVPEWNYNDDSSASDTWEPILSFAVAQTLGLPLDTFIKAVNGNDLRCLERELRTEFKNKIEEIKSGKAPVYGMLINNTVMKTTQSIVIKNVDLTQPKVNITDSAICDLLSKEDVPLDAMRDFIEYLDRKLEKLTLISDSNLDVQGGVDIDGAKGIAQEYNIGTANPGSNPSSLFTSPSSSAARGGVGASSGSVSQQQLQLIEGVKNLVQRAVLGDICSAEEAESWDKTLEVAKEKNQNGKNELDLKQTIALKRVKTELEAKLRQTTSEQEAPSQQQQPQQPSPFPQE